MFTPQSSKPDLWAIQQSVSSFWKENHIFEQSVEQRPEDNLYRFYDGPPFVTGLPHYGHLASSVAKDVIPRYQTMLGKRVERVRGWDCHGIPIEQKVQDKLGLSSSTEIQEVGMETFIEGCYDFTRSTSDEWKRYVDNFGRRVDFDGSYKTMDNDYMESIWRVFKQIWDKGLIYKGKRVSLYSTKLETPISNFEVAMDDSYEEVNDPAITVKFALKEQEGLEKIKEGIDGVVSMLAWTTTPWTIPAHIALGVNEELGYVLVHCEGEGYILAHSRVEDVFKGKEYEVVSEMKGSDLVGLTYEPPFDYYVEDKEGERTTKNEKEGGRRHVVVHAEFATDESGTGIVHQAPEFGEDDFNLGKAEGLLITEAMNAKGEYTEEITDMAGMYYRDANEPIMERLKESGHLFAKASITHRVAFCPRTHVPLVYKAQDSRFIDIQNIKDRLLAANEQINRYPEHFKYGRFAKSIESAPDRCISRSRYRGTPMPVYVPESDLQSGTINPEKAIVLGSIDELWEKQKQGSDVIQKREENGQVVYRNSVRNAAFDLHKPYVDDVRFEVDGEKYVRIPEVLDCWMESGSMPYGQMHYPFENREKMEASFPADYIVEYTGQIRAWFYVMHVLGVILFDKPAYKNVICHGVVSGNDGRKMSKSLGNFPDPKPTFQQYGGDAIRMSILTSPLFNAGDTSITEESIADALRGYVLPLWNAFSFFVTYANIDEWSPDDTPATSSNVLDQWIQGELARLTESISTDLDNYNLQHSSRALGEFLDNLTNRYIRRSRRRFWKTEHSDDKTMAYQTLYEVLVGFCQVAAPFMPFVTEYIYKELTSVTEKQYNSVHLTNWPQAGEYDKSLAEDMTLAQRIVTMGLAWRSQHDLHVRQPLSTLTVGVELSAYYQDIIREELNIKEVIFDAALNDEVTQIVKPDGKKIGPKFGKDVKTIFAEAKSGNFVEQDNGSVLVAGEFVLEAGEYEISYVKNDPNKDVIVDQGIVMSIDSTITPELELEGYVRDLVRAIQDARKEAEYDIADRIELSLTGDRADEMKEQFGDYIQQETLSTVVDSLESVDIEKEVELGESTVLFGLKR